MSDEEKKQLAGEGSSRTRRLRDFSTQLAERLKSATSSPNEPMRLAIRIGDAGYLLAMNAAAEIVATPDLPESPPAGGSP